MRRKVAALAILAASLVLVPSMAQATPPPDLGIEDPLRTNDPSEADARPGGDPVPLPFDPPTLVQDVVFACGSPASDPVGSAASSGSDSSYLRDHESCELVEPQGTEAALPTPLRVEASPGPALEMADATSTGTRPTSVDGGAPVQASGSTPAADQTTWPFEAKLVALTLAIVGLLAPLGLRSRSKEDNEIRRRIFEMVCEDPGISASAVADAIDVHLTTAIYHLDQLRDDDRIEGVQEGRSTLYFENHRKYGRMEKRVLSTLKKGTAAELLEMVAENPGIHPAELARQLDLSRTSIKWHTDRLADDGLLEKHPNGGTLQLQVPDRAEQLLHKYQGA